MAIKMCPIMSKPIATSFNDSCPDFIVTEFVEIECKKEKCALWVGLCTKEGDRIGPAEYGCAFALHAKKGPEGYLLV